MVARGNGDKAEWIDNGSPKLLALLENDVQRAIAWIGEQPLRTLSGPLAREWCDNQGWSKGYGGRVLDRAGEALKLKTEADAETVRARLLTLIERLIPECIEYQTGAGPAGEGTVFLMHPKKHGEHLTRIDHSAVRGYIAEIGKLTGVTNETTNHQHLHLVRAIKAGDLSEVPTSVLESQIAKLLPQEDT